MKKRESIGVTKSKIPVNTLSRKAIARRQPAGIREVDRSSTRPTNTNVSTKGDPPNRKIDRFNFVNDFFKAHVGQPAFQNRVKSFNQKNYYFVATCILQTIDHDFKGFGVSSKLYIEFKELMDLFGYPYQIRSHDLQSIGSENRVGPTLDPLFWLCKLVKSDIDLTPSQQKCLENIELRNRMIFFNFIKKTYEVWLQGDDKSFSKFEQDMSTFYLDLNEIQQQNESLQVELSQKQKELKSMEQVDDPRQLLSKENKDIEDNIEEKQLELKELDTLNKQKNEILNKLKKELEKEQIKLASIDEEMNKLEEQMNSMSIKPDELIKKIDEIHRIDSSREEQKKIKEDTLKQIKQAEIDCENEIKAIQSLVGDANEIIERLDKKKLINVNPDGSNENEILGIDLASFIKKVSGEMVMEEEIEVEQARVENERNNILEDLKALDQEAKDLSNEMKSMFTTKKKDIRTLRKEAADLLTEIKQKKNLINNEEKEAQEQLHILEDTYNQYKSYVEDKLQMLFQEIKSSQKVLG